MYKVPFDVFGIRIGCHTNAKLILNVLKDTFSKINGTNEMLVSIIIGGNTDYVEFAPNNNLVEVHFKELGDVESYGYHNATKWIIRAACWILEKRGNICLHAAGLSWHNHGILIVGGTFRAGKTTMALHILERGGKYVSDEYVFYDGRVCFGDPQIKSHVRVGTLKKFSRLINTNPYDELMPANHNELWFSDYSVALRFSDFYGSGLMLTSIIPEFVFLSNLAPNLQTAVVPINSKRVLPHLRKESLKHISKFWMKQGEELAQEKGISYIQQQLKNLGVNINYRLELITKLLQNCKCYQITGGNDFDAIIKAVEEVIISDPP